MAADLFGMERAPPRILDRKEAAALVEVLQALRTHPAVAWCERMNSGAARMGARFVRFGWPGSCAPRRPNSSGAYGQPVAWASWPATAATCCAS
jgi:hypothetical protein